MRFFHIASPLVICAVLTACGGANGPQSFVPAHGLSSSVPQMRIVVHKAPKLADVPGIGQRPRQPR